MVKTGFAALVALAALAVVACGGSTSLAGRSHAQPAVLSMAQVEALTRGHPTVLLFTAQGCASCEADARALQDATRGRSDVRLVGVDMTGDDTPQSLQSYVRAIGLESGSFVWMIDSGSTLTNRYAITSLSSGRARFVNQGPLDAGAYAEQIGGLH